MPDNLPVPLTSFIGREAAVAEVARLLQATSNGPRLLALTGPGGVGKTRLALRVASDLAAAYADGVWLVELAPLANPALVPQTLADVLGLREEHGHSLVETVTSYLRPRQALLVLDNCEHVIDACAFLSESLLRRCPNLHVLATSREPLGVAGETAWRVPPLTLPYAEHQPSVEEVGKSEAVRLFVERARAVAPSFSLTDRNVRAVAEICYRLDGIPLAIELAAARVRVVSIEEIAERLNDRLALLSGGQRTALPRHQALRATIDWSYDLLTPAERALFDRLAVFAGGWTLEAAETICGGARCWVLGSGTRTQDPTPSTPPVLDLLARLVDKSLVIADEAEDGTRRYHALETLRQYAQERLVASEELELIGRRHAAYFADLCEQAEPKINEREQVVWFERLKREYDNVRAALRWARDQGEAELGLRAAGSLGWFWELRGHHTEGRRWLGELLARPEAAGPTIGRAKALGAAGFLTWVQGEFARSRALFEEALTIARALDDRRQIGWALSGLACIARSQADYERSWTLFSEGLEVYRSINDAWGIAMETFLLGTIAYFQEDYPRARELLERSLELGRQIGDRWSIASSLGDLADVAYREQQYGAAEALAEESIAVASEMGMARVVAWRLFNLGRIALAKGDLDRASQHFRESLTTLREPGDRVRIAVVLEGQAGVAAARGALDRAGRLVGAASAIREAIGAPRSPGDQADLDRWLEPCQPVIREEARARHEAEGGPLDPTRIALPGSGGAWASHVAEGRRMSFDEVIEYALSDDAAGDGGADPPAANSALVTLTPREREVALLIARGYTNREIAEQLVISEGTARIHVAHILDRLGLRSRAQVAVWASKFIPGVKER